jgi:hypothetical protein
MPAMLRQLGNSRLWSKANQGSLQKSSLCLSRDLLACISSKSRTGSSGCWLPSRKIAAACVLLACGGALRC